MHNAENKAKGSEAGIFGPWDQADELFKNMPLPSARRYTDDGTPDYLRLQNDPTYDIEELTVKSPKDAASFLVDWLTGVMIKIWEKLAEPITGTQYFQRFTQSVNRYGFDFHDPFNMMVESYLGQGGHHLLRYDSVITKIPLLVDRRDTMPEFSSWLPQMQNVLTDKFQAYRNEIYASNNREAFSEFEKLPIAHQLGAVARLHVCHYQHLYPRPTRYNVRLWWGEPCSEIHIGIFKFVHGPSPQLQIVTFPLGFEENNDRSKIKDMCQKIRLANSGFELDKDACKVWSLGFQQGDVSSLPGFSSSDAQGSMSYDLESDFDHAATSGSEKEFQPGKSRWLYRPLDMSDSRGAGPFDVNIWHPMNYPDLYSLTRSWGIRSAFLIPDRNMKRSESVTSFVIQL
ncbi:hypothetical protein F4777DRAFT_150610 [Nemania sp. FL0916]|nr:hypothetical protein F4777DRAFT_150610 [Nemania sp. FL0916]